MSSSNHDSISFLSSTGVSENSIGASLRSDVLRSIGEVQDEAIDDLDSSSSSHPPLQQQQDDDEEKQQQHHHHSQHRPQPQQMMNSSFRNLLRRSAPRHSIASQHSYEPRRPPPLSEHRLSLRDIFLREPAVDPPKRPSPTPKQKKVQKVLLARGRSMDMTLTNVIPNHYHTNRSRLLQRSVSGIVYDHHYPRHFRPASASGSFAATHWYRPGDHVLVRCADIANPVNRFGFPPVGHLNTDSSTDLSPEEQRGPYAYVLAEVLNVHFEEIHPFYMLKRCDTGIEQRADADIIEHIRTKRGQIAATRAASDPNPHHPVLANGTTAGQPMPESSPPWLLLRQKFAMGCSSCVYVTWMLPVSLLCRCWGAVTRQFQQTVGNRCLTQARLFLYGLEPYILQTRCTVVNLMVVCSLWFVFMDQIRLAALPPTADHGLAIVSLIIWVVLVTELIMEAFIRPDNYRHVIRMEKAYSPETRRYMNGIQLAVEGFSLMLFTSEFWCIFRAECCSQRYSISLYNALLWAVTGNSRLEVLGGSAYIALTRLRIFGLVRHWKNMWLNAERSSATGEDSKRESLKSASNIGTAILSNNTYHALIGSFIMTGLFPMLLTQKAAYPHSFMAMIRQLQSINLIADDNSNSTCSFLDESVNSWTACLESRSFLLDDKPLLLSLQMEPARCNISTTQFITNATFCSSGNIRGGSVVKYVQSTASLFGNSQIPENETIFSVSAIFDQSTMVGNAALASLLLQFSTLGLILFGLSIMRNDAEVLVLGPLRKMLSIVAHYAKNPLTRPRVKRRRGPQRSRISARLSGRLSGVETGDESDVSSFGDSSDDDEAAAVEVGSFETEQLITAVAKITDLLRKCWGVAGADIISTNLATQEGALTEVFNPTVPGRSVYALFGFAAIGGFENAVRNLGGDIMPLINDIAAVLHGEVARWGFGESGGECNKNLGGAFLMVYRIGLVNDVIEKLEQATDVVFSPSTVKSTPSCGRRRPFRGSADSSRYSSGVYSAASSEKSSGMRLGSTTLNRRKGATRTPANAMGLSLKSLPGISIFADRAVIGMLKSFAGINRDHKILSWNDDFRLGAGVGAFRINMFFGMDAGWAVEGAVGSEYKIDATYLSPHVNMASRMTSACKQYDVTLMLSQSVQELLSEVAQSKLRHIDTVTVKGSSVKQNIYTYDAKARGVDFFLYSKSEDQADFDADRYSPNIWNSDSDLVAMRQHITDAFLAAFSDGHKDYLRGAWPSAIKKLELANNIMFQNAVDEGYLEDEFDALGFSGGVDVRGAADELKRENGDGPCMYLLNFMRSHGGHAPSDWGGWHALTGK